MKNHIIIFVISILMLLSACQSTKGLKRVTNKVGYDPLDLERYYVLKTDKNVKAGRYFRMRDNIVLQSGYYLNNLKDSLWTEYSPVGNVIATGAYSENIKVGGWKYYSNYGDLIQVYDHTNNQMLYYDIEQEHELFPPQEISFHEDDTRLIEPPIFIGGTTYLNNIVEAYLMYPVDDRKNEIQGRLLVEFTVSKKGKLVNVNAMNSISHGIDAEGIRLIKLFGDYWIPGKENGEAVDVVFAVPLKFKID